MYHLLINLNYKKFSYNNNNSKLFSIYKNIIKIPWEKFKKALNLVV